MKTMKTISDNILKVFVILAIAIITMSCSKDDEAKMPEILEFELGHNNSKTVRAGSNLHIDAGIIAENRIDVIEIDIHYEGEHVKSLRVAVEYHGWEFEITYDKFRGLKNTTFHEDIPVPADAKPGEYHFHFKVIDMEGYAASFEDDLIVLTPEIE
jgi:hypothetical protein